MFNTLLKLLNNYSTKQANKQKNQPKEIVLLLLHSHNVCVYFSPMYVLMSDHNSEKTNKSWFSIFCISTNRVAFPLPSSPLIKEG